MVEMRSCRDMGYHGLSDSGRRLRTIVGANKGQGEFYVQGENIIYWLDMDCDVKAGRLTRPSRLLSGHINEKIADAFTRRWKNAVEQGRTLADWYT
jgi:hypothetical protein